MFKKFLILCLTLMLCLSFVPAVNAAEEAEREIFTSGNYRYALLDDGTAEITMYLGEGASVTVPDSLDGHKVTRIGDLAFYYCDALTAVTIPDSVTEMGANPWAHEKDSLVDTEHEVSLRHDEKTGTLTTDLYGYLKGFSCGKIDTEKLGLAFEPEQPFESPDGSPIAFDTDFYGDPRTGDRTIPGPFAAGIAQ